MARTDIVLLGMTMSVEKEITNISVNIEQHYNFISVEQLINDFMLDIKEIRENDS